MGAVKSRLNLPLQMVKNHLRVEVEEDDALIQDYIQSALDEADDFLNNDFDWMIESLGRGNGSVVDFSTSLKPVFKVRWLAVDGYGQSEDTHYTIDKTTGVITFVTAPEYGDQVVIEYEATAPIPERVRTWVLARVAHKYEHRTAGVQSETDGSGSVSWAKPDYTEIAQLRRNPGF